MCLNFSVDGWFHFYNVVTFLDKVQTKFSPTKAAETVDSCKKAAEGTTGIWVCGVTAFAELTYRLQNIDVTGDCWS